MEKHPTFFKNPATGQEMKPGTKAAEYRTSLDPIVYLPTLSTRSGQKI